MKTRGRSKKKTTFAPLKLEVLRHRCQVANPLSKIVSRPKAQTKSDSRGGESLTVSADTDKVIRREQCKRLQKLCRLDINPIQPLCGVALQCRRMQANLSQSAVARMTGSSEAYIDAVEIGTQSPSHELWQRLVASIV